MQRWDLAAANDSDRPGPRVLFSMPEARAVVIDLAAGEELRDHQVRERAVLQVLAGSAECASGGESATCGQGTLVLFEPGETHSCVRSDATRLLLIARAVARAGALRRHRSTRTRTRCP